MIVRRVSLLDEFRCLAGDCPESCCKGWAIGIDEASLNRYASLPGAFGRTVREAIDWSEGYFKIKDQHCALLNEQGLCRLILELGEEALCETCRVFPRHIEEYPGFRELSLSMSCPEAARAYLSEKQVSFICEERKETDTDWEEEELENAKRLLPGLFRLREKVFALLKEGPLNDPKLRLFKGLAFACQLALEDGVDIEWEMEDFLQKALPILPKIPKEEAAVGKWDKYSKERHLFLSLQEIEPAFREKIRMAEPVVEGTRSFEIAQGILLSPERRQEMERLELAKKRLIAYYTDVYLPGAIFDGDLYTKICLGILASDWLEVYCLNLLLRNKELTLEEITAFASAFASQIEHSNENLLKVFDFLAEEAGPAL